LLTDDGKNWDTTAPFQVGDIWDMDYTPVDGTRAPHTEDVLVSQYRSVGTEPDLRAHLCSRVTCWQGGTNQLFGGVLRYTSSNNGFVSQQLGIPDRSTWFWIPDRDLTLRSDGRHYDYPDQQGPRGLVYVGEAEPLPTLPSGTLVRVSLARWWKPNDADPSLEERCYLQLSGWF